MDFIRTLAYGYDGGGVEVDIESQRVDTASNIVTSTSKKRTNKFSSVKKHDVPLNIAVFNELDIIKGNDPATESDTSDSSFEEDTGSPVRVTRERMVLSPKSKKNTRIDYSAGRSTEQLPTKRFQTSDETPDTHFVWFAHGKFWTVFAILCAWTGLVCANEARNSTSFVTVKSPIYIDASFNEVQNIGMLNFMLCFNQTKTGMSACSMHELDVDDVNDKMFQIARSMAFISLLMGGFLAGCITLSIAWYSINLRPVGIDFLLAYFFQSFTFLFFDTRLCRMHLCHVSEGSTYSIVASFCWILACVATSRMENFKYQQKRAMELANRRTNPSKPSGLDRGISDVTKETEASYCSTSPRNEDVESGNGKNNGCFMVLVRDLRDLEESEDWRARPRQSRADTHRREDAPKSSRRGRSQSSKRTSSREGSSTKSPKSRGRSVDIISQHRSTRPVSVSRRGPDSTVSSSKAPRKHLGESVRPRRTSSQSKAWEKETPGRKAIRTHSQSRSKKLDTRHFDL